MSNKVKIVHISDMHLGHHRVQTELTIASFKDIVVPLIKECDIFISGGDMFDQSLKLDNNSALDALALSDLLRTIAKEHNTKLRFLRGTFTHDRNQNKIFDNTRETNVDVKCIDSLSIEYIKDLDIHVLYMPDNLPYRKVEEILKFIDELMYDNNISNVDLIVGHGYFDHVLPKGLPVSNFCFSQSDFDEITNGPILMGHVHTHSVYKNVIYNGSFNRLNHGEEESKGFGYLELYKDNYNYKFIENKEAVLFTTIELKGTNIEDIIHDTMMLIKDLGIDKIFAHLRLKHVDSEIRQIVSQILSTKYPNLTITHKSIKEEEKSYNVDCNFIEYNFEKPNVTNISELIFSFIKENREESIDLTINEISDILEL